MTVLVTGASSMLGGAVARALRDRGEQVRVFQRRPAAIAGVEEMTGDIRDPDAVRRAVSGTQAVLHLAAKVGVSGAWHDFAAANVNGTSNVLQALAAENVGRLVYVSSPSVAHSGRPLVAAGAEPPDPIHARGNYSRSKAFGEQMAMRADGLNLKVVVIRPHLVWGPGDTQLVGPIVERARAGRLVLIGSGAALIDTTYVDNAAAAIIAGLDRCDQAHGQALVVSNGEPRPVADLFGRLCEAAGLAPPSRFVPFRLAWLAGGLLEPIWPRLHRADDPPITRFLAEQLATAHWFDQRHTREVLRWTPAVRLDEGFERLERWFAQPRAVGGGRSSNPRSSK